MNGRRSQALARAGVRLAARLLPTVAARSRYQAEFLAELHGLPPATQLRHTAGVLARFPALRAAVRAAPEEDAVLLLARRGPFWRGRLLRWHDFAVRTTADGGRYQQCVRCGTDRGPGVAPPDDHAALAGR